jgi:hypothetical protein
MQRKCRGNDRNLSEFVSAEFQPTTISGIIFAQHHAIFLFVSAYFQDRLCVLVVSPSRLLPPTCLFASCSVLHDFPSVSSGLAQHSLYLAGTSFQVHQAFSNTSFVQCFCLCLRSRLGLGYLWLELRETGFLCTPRWLLDLWK